MRLPSLLLLLAASVLRGYAQAPAPLVQGTVLDQKTRKPIPYAWVDLKAQKARFFADSLGRFVIEAPGQFRPDTLIGMALGYAATKQAFIPQGNAGMPAIVLQKVPPLPGELDKFMGRKVVPLALGALSRQPGEGMIHGMPGSQYTLFIKNEKGQELENIRTAAFYIAESGQPRTRFRVRVYSLDKASGGPGHDLLLDNVVVSAPRGGGWFTVDLTPYNIPAPKEGFFVAMEWLQPPKLNAATFQESGSLSGQALRPTFEFKESRTWHYIVGRGWNLLPLINGNGRAYNAMIRAEVDMVK